MVSPGEQRRALRKARNVTATYEDFVAGKGAARAAAGIDPGGDIAPHLFPFQRDLVRWALRRGRAALFADTGLGKTAMQVEFARHVSARGRVLIVTPLAVAQQTVREAARFGVHASYGRSDTGASIDVCNYDMLHTRDPSAYAGVVLDESSILKAFDGKTRTALISMFAETPYRLCCTATPAPNDFTELGNHSEFLGLKTRSEMLAEYFVHDGGSTQDWRVKGHAITPFWRWVATWGAVVKAPSDLGYDDGDFALPPLRMHEHVVPTDGESARRAGMLFVPEAATLADQRAVRRATISGRVAEAVRIVNGHDPAIVWCELNDEADAAAGAIEGAIQVAGSDDADVKADRLVGFAEGRHRVLVSKPSICGWGLNWQHASRMVFVGASHSYEQTYQAIRRCWRFGQTRPVDVHVVRSDADSAVIANYRRKEADASRMAAEMRAHVGDAVRAEVRGLAREWNPYQPQVRLTVPDWIGKESP